MNRKHAVHNTRGRKRRALDATPVCAAVQTKLDVDHFVQHSRNKRLELLEVRIPTRKTANSKLDYNPLASALLMKSYFAV